jgi:hypothetical protein
MAGEPAGAVGANLAVMFQGQVGGAGRTTLWEIGPKIGMEGSWALRQHGRQISMEMRASCPATFRQVPEASTSERCRRFPNDSALDHPQNNRISESPRSDDGEQGKCGLDRFIEGRQGHDFDGDGRAE